MLKQETWLHSFLCHCMDMGFLGSPDGNESPWNLGDPSLILGSGRSPGEGNGSPLQFSFLENSMDRGAWRAIALVVTELDRPYFTCSQLINIWVGASFLAVINNSPINIHVKVFFLDINFLRISLGVELLDHLYFWV